MRYLAFAVAYVLLSFQLPVATAQSAYRLAEPCDCTGTCASEGALSAILESSSGDLISPATSSGGSNYSLSDFTSLQGLARQKANGNLGTLDADSYEYRLIDELAERYEPKTFDTGQLNWDGIARDLALASNPATFLYNVSIAGLQEVIEPTVGTKDLDPRWIKFMPEQSKQACKRAVEEDMLPSKLICNSAVSSLCKDGCGREDMFRQLASHDPKLRSGILAKLIAYSDACLSIDRPSVDIGLSKTAEAEVLARTGFLAVASQPIGRVGAQEESLAEIQKHRTCDAFVAKSTVNGTFCTAVAIDEQTVLTARHCFFQPRTESAWNGAKSCLDVGRLEFYRPSLAHEPISLRPLEDESAIEYAGSGLMSDHVRLDLSEPARQVNGKVIQADPAAFDKVLIPGFNPLYLYGTEGAPTMSWSKGGCRVIVANERCALTRCQTFGGTSGAPLWRADGDSDRPQLVGLHVRDAGESAADCKFPSVSGFPRGLNVALTSAVANRTGTK